MGHNVMGVRPGLPTGLAGTFNQHLMEERRSPRSLHGLVTEFRDIGWAALHTVGDTIRHTAQANHLGRIAVDESVICPYLFPDDEGEDPNF
ncbi:MAG: hypothetical protein M3Q36_02530 [bacterium]|nr:hypothetical protein [bacterium]